MLAGLCRINRHMSTIRELITGSLRLINVVQANEVPTADDMNVSFEAFNSMLDNWSTEKLTIFSFTYYDFVYIPGQYRYTLGPGGDWNVVRPMEVMNMYTRYLAANTGNNPIDLPMEQLTWDQYSALAVKTMQARFPIKWYDDGNSPLRTITVWPVPQTAEGVRLWLWQPLVDPTSIDEQFLFPKGYERALRFALAVELAPEFGKAVPDQVKRIASNSKATIRRINSVPQIMRGDIAIASNRPSLFNYVVGDTIPTNM